MGSLLGPPPVISDFGLLSFGVLGSGFYCLLSESGFGGAGSSPLLLRGAGAMPENKRSSTSFSKLVFFLSA